MEVCSAGDGGNGGSSELPTGPAGIQGVVYHGDDMRRTANASIELSTGHTTTASESGYFTFENLPVATVTITASAPGFSTASVSRELSSGDLTWGSVRLQ